MGDPDDLVGVLEKGEWQGVGNEFTGAQVRKVWTRNGERLQIFIPQRGSSILLDAMQLEIIAAQDASQFTKLFERKLDNEHAAGLPGSEDEARP
jgi:hypothetical protein